MELNISKSIRALRMQKGVTQETLAAHLGVSYQAVSKWETGTTAPDIALLPDIAVYFGVPIDTLFALPEDARLSRIENMLSSTRHLPRETFESTESYLQGLLAQQPDHGRACFLMSYLYVHHASSLRDVAIRYAQHAVKQSPDSKRCHSLLIEAMNGVPGDDYLTRHDVVIRFYKDFAHAHPDSLQAHMRLLVQLLYDSRLLEAEEVLARIRSLSPGHERVLFYEGDILYARGDIPGAIALWERAKGDHDGPMATGFFLYAERMERLGRYEEALDAYEKDYDLAEKPRFIDPLAAMARILEMRGDMAEAIALLEEEKRVFLVEWGIASGEAIDAVQREIERLKRGMEG